MHAEIHLLLHDVRATELRHQAEEFNRIPRTPRAGLRHRLGWTLVELGLHLIPNRPALPSRSPRTA
ncbi:hypothetical protein AB0L71_29485 [Streptomyces sp. NPDC052052]|uniref:hypothetical protein n=1 Tax=Streptomyces sp. NPDC052052 TaxID=3154756 RepID=UPI0034238987